MRTADVQRETTAHLIQIVAEIDRGVLVAIEETKAGRMYDARQTLTLVRELIEVQDALLSSHLKHNAIRTQGGVR